MAKLLFFNVPAYGHVNPTLPVVTELVQRGHHVVYYNAATFEQAIRGTGAEFQPYPNSNMSESEFARRISNLADVSVFILEETIRLLPFVLHTLEQEQPDVVVFDSLALWGMQAARLHGLASVASISTFVHEGVTGLLTWRDYLYVARQAWNKLPVVQRLRRQLVQNYGTRIFPDKSTLPCKGDLNIVYTSREFQPDTRSIDDSFCFVGPSLASSVRQATDFSWEALDPERTKVYVSLGTLYNQNSAFYRTVFSAFADHSAQFILAVGRSTDIQALGPVPDNFIVRPAVPQLQLLQHVSLFVTHGGMNSVNESLNYAVPLVVVPQQIEQLINGRQVARQSAGVVLGDRPPYGRVDVGSLRHAVDTVLSDPIYRQNSERLRRSFHEAGGYKQAAAAILSRLNP